MEGASALSTALTNMTTVISSVVSVITGNTILMTMFVGGLLVVGAGVFRKIKNSAK